MTPRGALRSLWLAAALAAPAWADVPLMSPDRTLAVTPPPGWTSTPSEDPAVLFRLGGPLRESAVVSRLTLTQYLYNRQAVSLSLEQQLNAVAAQTAVSLTLDPKLRHGSFASGAEVDYRIGAAPGRPALLMGLCRFQRDVLLVQVASPRAEERLAEILGSLQRAGPAFPASSSPAKRESPFSLSRLRRERAGVRALVVFWVLALLALGAAMVWKWRDLRRPSGRRSAGR